MRIALEHRPVAGSRDNDFEGVFLDDFIIGLAERGEQVIDPRPAGSPLDTAFVADTRFAFPEPDDPQSDLNTGSYQVEIRGRQRIRPFRVGRPVPFIRYQ